MYGSFAFTHETTIYSITYLAQKAKYFPNFIMQEISLCDVSEISTKAPCEVALIGERHVRIEISDFVMRTFVLLYSASLPSALSLWITSSILWTTLTKSSSL